MPLRNLPIKTGHLFIGLAVLMFFVAIFSWSSGSGKKETKIVKTEIPTQNVVVPLVPINEGKTISSNDVQVVKWPKEFIPQGETFGSPSEVSGRVAKQDLFPGEPIYLQKVSGSNTNGGLPAVIPNGLRAVSVAVTEVKGVAGFVKPGDRVDVLTTFEIDKAGADKQRLTKTVLQNVLVLASAQTMVDDTKYNIDTPEGVTRGEATPKPVGEKASADAKKEEPKKDDDKDKDKDKDAEKAARLVSSVTLALTPQQTETLALAEESGDIRLSLRPENDRSIAKLEGANFDELMGKARPQQSMIPRRSGRMPAAPRFPAMPAPAVMGAQVEFIQGTDKTLYNFNQ